MLGRRNEIDRERELNTLYKLLTKEKGKLQEMKGTIYNLMMLP